MTVMLLRVSFIVTYYNEPLEMLEECIQSILALPFFRGEKEILLIDDGSKIPAPEFDGVTVIRQENQGLSAARNKGLELAKGEYIQIIDGDDFLIQAPYEHCLDIVRDKDPDIVNFYLSEKEEHTVPNEYDGPMEGSEYMRRHNLRASACGYIFRKLTLVNLRFTSGILHEDEEFTPQLFLRAEKLYATNAKAYYYRHRSQSITHEDNKKWILQRLSDTRGVLYRLSERADTLPTAEREALQRRIDQLTMDYIYSVITLTHNGRFLEKCVEELRQKGLFPLPDKDYTQKYKWFRRISSTRNGRRLLCMLLR